MTQTAARYKKGVRLDNPMLSPDNMMTGASGVETKLFRAKTTILPNGHFEISVSCPSPASIEAMGRVVPPSMMIPKIRTEKQQAERDAENKLRACRRAKQTVRHKLKAIDADHMITLGYPEVINRRQHLFNESRQAELLPALPTINAKQSSPLRRYCWSLRRSR